jgi:uncharacterized RDD family membrane protein YckC
VDRRTIGSWLEGPGTLTHPGDQRYRGERLGLPEDGPGSIAGVGRRLGALCVDWLLSYLIARGVFGADSARASGQLLVLAIFAAENLLLLSTLGFTVGKRIAGVRLVSLRGERPGTPTPLDVVIRTVLLCLVVPAVIYDRDTRGLHDRATHTAVVRL